MNDPHDHVRDAMARLAATVAAPTNVDTVLTAVTAHAVHLIKEVDVADVMLVDEGRFRSMAATRALAAELNTLQFELQEGPCLTAAEGDEVVVCSDLNEESRWPRFAAAAVEIGVQSMMSFQLYSVAASVRGGTGGRGALNLFSYNRCRFTIEEQTIGAMLATHAATALIAADRQTQFESALASRDTIGQAKGILMERFKLDAVGAFNLITKLSQDTNTPVRIVAERIVESARD